MNNKDKIKWLEEREQKLEELESIINEIQSNVNDNKKISNTDDIKMEIFKLWYFNRFNKKYNL